MLLHEREIFLKFRLEAFITPVNLRILFSVGERVFSSDVSICHSKVCPFDSSLESYTYNLHQSNGWGNSFPFFPQVPSEVGKWE